jgi:1,4-dihydroxy-2-naphthoate octaprenyltransferase
MFWFIAIVILLVILWPYVLPLLAPVGTFLVVIASAPVVWTLKLIRRPKTQEEEDKLTKDASKGAALLLCLLLIGLLTWLGIKSI